MRFTEMIKPLLLLSVLLIVSNSAISQSEPKQTNVDPESAALFENEQLSDNEQLSVSAVKYEKVEKYDDAELVCTKERKTGTRIYTKICRTKAQIEAERADGAEFINRARSTPQSSGEGNG